MDVLLGKCKSLQTNMTVTTGSKMTFFIRSVNAEFSPALATQPIQCEAQCAFVHPKRNPTPNIDLNTVNVKANT